MRWFFPAWHGDHRLEADAEDERYAKLTITNPSPDETRLLSRFLAKAQERGWTSLDRASGRSESIALEVSVGQAGKLLQGLLKPRSRSITAVRFESGTVEVVENADATALHALIDKAEPPASPPAAAASANETKPEDKGESAVTTRRPTPSCPQCMRGAIQPATEVLLAFLNEREHHEWAHTRTIEVTGGLSGHRYLLGHRHGPEAARWGRICYDLDDDGVLHFHDSAVPPEEEVLAAKLLLEHREPWLRNEATCLTVLRRFSDVFKNPFGDWSDGVWDAGVTRRLGELLGGGRT